MTVEDISESKDEYISFKSQKIKKKTFDFFFLIFLVYLLEIINGSYLAS